jgi:hypothetical protein
LSDEKVDEKLAEKKLEPPTWKYTEPVEGAGEYYVNHLQIFWSGVDVTLFFGKLLHSGESLEKNILDIETRAKVTMPWSVAKLAFASLGDALKKYEEKNGELKLPGQYKLP